MKSILKKTALTVSVICLIGTGTAFTQQPTAKSILKKNDAAEGFRSNYSEAKQIITTSGGSKRTLVMRGWSINNGDRQLSEYLSPSDIKGQKILMTEDGDNIWMFNPETRRTRKLGSHMKKKKVMGSDFTYEDQSGGKQSEKYNGKVIKTENQGGVDCHVLDLKPTPKGPSYSRVKVWVGKKDYITRRVDFYQDGESAPFKRMISSEISREGKKIVAHRITMTNLEDNTKTIMVIKKIKFGVKIPASIFQARNLQK